jgi:DNA-binding transcriptional regulator LsrR (DeoR family)
MTPEERNHLTEKKKEAGTRRFREIQEYLSQGLTKEQVATMLKIQVASIERTLERAKKRGLTQ